MAEDNWQHRSANMRCATCMYFVEKKPPKPVEMNVPAILYTVVGRCRRRAPSMNGFPVVFLNDWCGEHKIDEGKLQDEVKTT